MTNRKELPVGLTARVEGVFGDAMNAGLDHYLGVTREGPLGGLKREWIEAQLAKHDGDWEAAARVCSRRGWYQRDGSPWSGEDLRSAYGQGRPLTIGGSLAATERPRRDGRGRFRR